jgi:hypothetical protein
MFRQARNFDALIATLQEALTALEKGDASFAGSSADELKQRHRILQKLITQLLEQKRDNAPMLACMLPFAEQQVKALLLEEDMEALLLYAYPQRLCLDAKLFSAAAIAPASEEASEKLKSEEEYMQALMAYKSERKAEEKAQPKRSLFNKHAYVTQGVSQDKIPPTPLPDQFVRLILPPNSLFSFMRTQRTPPTSSKVRVASVHFERYSRRLY